MSCYVHNCPNNAKTSKDKNRDSGLTNYFPSPENKILLEKWRRVTPRGDKLLSPCDKLCDLHFLNSEVVWFTETKLPNGNVRRLLRDEPILRPGTIPSIFPSEKLDNGKTTVKAVSVPKERQEPPKSILKTPIPIVKSSLPKFVAPKSGKKNSNTSKTPTVPLKEKIDTSKSSGRIRLKEPIFEKRLPQRVKRRSTILDDYVTDDELNQVHYHHERRAEASNSSKRRKTEGSGMQPVIRLVPLECLMDKKAPKNKLPTPKPAVIGRPSTEEIDFELKKVIEIPLLTGLKPKKSVTFKAKQDSTQFKPPKKTISKTKARMMLNSASDPQSPSHVQHSSEASGEEEESNQVKTEVPDIEEELARMEMDEDSEDIKPPDILSSNGMIEADDVIVKSEEEETDGAYNSDAVDGVSNPVTSVEAIDDVTIKSEDEETHADECVEDEASNQDVMESQTTNVAVVVCEVSEDLSLSSKEGSAQVSENNEIVETSKIDEGVEKLNQSIAVKETGKAENADVIQQGDHGSEVAEKLNEEEEVSKEVTEGTDVSQGQQVATEESRIQEVEDIVGSEEVDSIDKMIEPLECAMISLAGEVENTVDASKVMEVQPPQAMEETENKKERGETVMVETEAALSVNQATNELIEELSDSQNNDGIVSQVENQQDDVTNQSDGKDDREDEIMKLLAEGQNSEAVHIDDSLDLLTDSEMKESTDLPMAEDCSKVGDVHAHPEGEDQHAASNRLEPEQVNATNEILVNSEESKTEFEAFTSKTAVNEASGSIDSAEVGGSVMAAISEEIASTDSAEVGESVKAAISEESDSVTTADVNATNKCSENEEIDSTVTAAEVSGGNKEVPSSSGTSEEPIIEIGKETTQADDIIDIEDDNEEETPAPSQPEANDEIDLTSDQPSNDSESVTSVEHGLAETEQTVDPVTSNDIEMTEAPEENGGRGGEGEVIMMETESNEKNDNVLTINIDDDDEDDGCMDADDAIDVEDTEEANDDEVTIIAENECDKQAGSSTQQDHHNEDEIDIEAEVARLESEVAETSKKGKDKAESGVKEDIQAQEIIIQGNAQLVAGEITAPSVQNLFSPETIQEILKQIKLPLTAPVTLRIAPMANSPTSSSKSSASGKTTKKKGGRGTRAQILRPSSSTSGLNSSIEQFRHLTKTRTVFEFPTYISDIEDDVQFWKLSQIVKESYHELIEARNTKTSIGKLTLNISVNRPKALLDAEVEACGSVSKS